MSKYKYGTARIALFKEFDIEKSYTLEASLYGSKNQHFSLEDYLEIGKNFIIGLFLLFHEEEINARVLKILIAKNMDTFNNLGEEASLEKDIKNLVGSVW